MQFVHKIRLSLLKFKIMLWDIKLYRYTVIFSSVYDHITDAPDVSPAILIGQKIDVDDDDDDDDDIPSLFLHRLKDSTAVLPGNCWTTHSSQWGKSLHRITSTHTTCSFLWWTPALIAPSVFPDRVTCPSVPVLTTPRPSQLTSTSTRSSTWTAETSDVLSSWRAKSRSTMRMGKTNGVNVQHLMEQFPRNASLYILSPRLCLSL